MRNIYLVGMVGVGKSTIGKLLSEKLEWGFIDMDEMVETIYNLTIEEIFNSYGETAFHDMENKILLEVSQGNQQIIACSEGMLKNTKNLSLVKVTGLLFWLEAPVETLVNRIKDSKYLFLLTDDHTKILQEWLTKRKDLYQQSDVIVSTAKYSPEEVAAAIRKIAFDSGKYQF